MAYIPWFLVIALYTPVFIQLYGMRWRMIDYNHAYFILPVALWLAWRQREQIKRSVARHHDAEPSALALIVFGLLMFVFGWREEYLLITTFSMIPVLFGLTRYLYGRDASRSLAFPILYLLFLMPPPLGILDNITFPMRYGVSVVAAMLLNMIDVPVVRDGLLLSMGGQEIYMGEACSGFRSLITLLALTLVYVHISPENRRKKIILVAAIVPLALLGNLLRTVVTCLLAYYWGGKTAEGFFHTFSGLVIFGVMIAGLLWLEKHLSRPRTEGSLYDD